MTDAPPDTSPGTPSDTPDTSGDTKRSGFIALIGAPNAGKSTLLNSLVGSKVSIVSPKVQTTRTRVLGICIAGDAQVVFIDTPGIFAPKKRLERAMVAAAWGGATDADLVVLLVDARKITSRAGDVETRDIIAKLKDSGKKAFLAINKIDLVKREDLLKITDDLSKTGVFDEIFMISALSGDGVDDLMAAVSATLPPGPWFFPEDQISDMPQRLLAAEVTREKVFLQLHQELPYAAAVETETWTEFDNGDVRIDQVIYVERDSQKGIVLGKGGKRVKEIGQAARKDLEEMLDRKVHLFLRVKLKGNWSDDPGVYKGLGLDFNA